MGCAPMSIDISSESLISLADAAASLPRRRAGKKTHVSCVYRWTQLGCRGVLLESIQIGGTRCTSKEAIARFFGTLTAQADHQPVVPAPGHSRKRRQQIEAAERRLTAAGV